MIKCLFLLPLLLCALPVSAQVTNIELPPTALQSLAALQKMTAREKLTGLVEVSGKGGQPTPLAWRIVFFEPRSATKTAAVTIRGNRVEERNASREFYPANEPPGFFEMSKVEVDCVGAFRIADKEAGKAMVGFDTIDYRLRCRELSEEPVWTLTLRAKSGAAQGTITLSAQTGKVLRTVWYRTGLEGKLVIEDSGLPQEFLPPSPEKMPDPFPVPPTPAALPVPPLPLTPAAPVSPATPAAPGTEPGLPPPPPLPPLGAPPPVPNITPD